MRELAGGGVSRERGAEMVSERVVERRRRIMKALDGQRKRGFECVAVDDLPQDDGRAVLLRDIRALERQGSVDVSTVAGIKCVFPIAKEVVNHE